MEPSNATQTPEQEAKTDSLVDDLLKHPLFMDPSKLSEKDFEENEDLAALRSIQYSESETPEYLAQEAKKRGNQAFKRGPVYYKHAIRYYTDAAMHCKAIQEPSQENIQMYSQLFSNRAAVHLGRKDYEKCVTDCQTAIGIWKENIKAYFRQAKALIELNRITPAFHASCQALAIAPKDPSMLKLKQLIDVKLAEAELAKKQANAQDSAQQRQLEAVRKACAMRKMKVGRPLLTQMRQSPALPYVGDDHCLHWPVLILYAEHGQSDYIEDWHEAVTFDDMLSNLLPDSGPAAPWDKEGVYRKSSVSVYYQKNFVKPLQLDEVWTDTDGFTPNAPASKEEENKVVEMVKVPLKAPLIVPLTAEDYVVPDIPVFFILAKGSEYTKTWEKAYGNITTLKVPDSL